MGVHIYMHVLGVHLSNKQKENKGLIEMKLSSRKIIIGRALGKLNLNFAIHIIFFSGRNSKAGKLQWRHLLFKITKFLPFQTWDTTSALSACRLCFRKSGKILNKHVFYECCN